MVIKDKLYLKSIKNIYLFVKGYAIANLTIRLNCDLSSVNQQIDKRWLQEDLSSAIERLLKRLYENTQQAKTFNQLSIARLDYCLPLFKVSLKISANNIKHIYFFIQNVIRHSKCTNEWTTLVLNICREYFSSVSTTDSDVRY